MLENLLTVFGVILLAYCSFTAAYLFILSFSGRFFYRNPLKASAVSDYKRIAVLVPSYKEDNIIEATIHNLLSQNYPRQYFDVVIIADSFQPATLGKLEKLDIRLIKVVFEKSTKTKALNRAMQELEGYDIALICDADNMLVPSFLSRVNQAFQAGTHAFQGCRVAKNLDSSFAILDACSESINNHLFRKGANGLKLSSAVIGSGMAFRFSQIKSILASMEAVGGFDKILQLELIKGGSFIHFDDLALAFDEKVGNSAAFQQQRKRWLSSQFIYFRKFFGESIRQLLKGNFSYFNLAVIVNLILPRALLFLLFPFTILVSYFIGGMYVSWSWLTGGLFLLAMLLAFPWKMVNKDLGKAILHLPGAIGLMFLNLFHLKKANQTFIHTVHTKTEIDNKLFRDKALKDG